ncbi:transcriptional regulator, LuxR family [Kribbella flavida DSM 17836]|uniref:Transcriptional regulator, LuxR family n=1 Tax=Kribbella flavida (strain DSM 17836 / JCM 10339 / NBRC 14399) TaxID=479435 RepID=D2PWM4_KRIFD|nr:LuxR family transcriptional regulator [Kribbella flavida]ADB33493.1 transcriptional regulator, LuxR family [Kribbella flavida DSM 17836]
MRTPSPPLLGRREAVQRLDQLVEAARKGNGGALVLRGEAGIGKSALLDHGRQAAAGFWVIEASGSEFETELPFAALHQLCVPVLGHLGELSQRHSEALQVAFGLAAGRPDFFGIGLATLELLAAASRRSPLLCVVDDAQWLDDASAKVLTFLARRLASEPVAMVFAARTPDGAAGLEELPGLVLEGLNDGDARALLAAESAAPIDEQVRDRILAEARGNPLALLELPRAGGFAMPDTSSVPNRIERSFEARLLELPAGARLLLTVASADPTGDPGLLWRAAQQLGVDVTAASTAAEASGLVEFSTRVRFCHPLARSAAYRTAATGERQAAHRALAAVTASTADPDRQVWHRAQGNSGPDDELAAALEQSAARAQARGGVAAAAAFLERAAALSLDPALRAERTLAAVQAKLDAGMTDAAADLLTTVETSAVDEAAQARVDLLHGQIDFVRHAHSDGAMSMVRAAHRLAPVDALRSRDCFLDALEMGLVVGRAGGVMDMVLNEARSAPAAPQSPDLLDALVLLATEGHQSAVPLVRQVLADSELWTRRPALATVLAAELWDLATHAEITAWLVRTGREIGSPLLLRLGLAQLACRAVASGEFTEAMAAVAEEEAVADALGVPTSLYPQLHLAAMRGRRQEAFELIATATSVATDLGSGLIIANVHWATALLNNALADYPAALAAARQAVEAGDLYLAGIALPELVEAAVRCDEHAVAAAALESLTERTAASGTSWGLGVAAFARALVTDAEDNYVEAVERLGDSPALPYRGRAHLLYGEWLRREGRRRDAREHLRTAHELFSGTGMEAFARRAADELRATGEVARNRSTDGGDQLTLQEVHIARLVATGATSKEVASRLFLSPRTVDAHLRNIFRKLGITSRRQLKDLPHLVT